MATIQGYYLSKIRYDKNFQKRVDKYLSRESWSSHEWSHYQEKKLDKLLKEARKYVPFYNDYWSSKKDSFLHLDNWPIISKAIIMKNPLSFIDDRYKNNRLYKDHTSGTTGTPLEIYLDYDSVREQYAFFHARVKFKYGIKFNDRWAIIGSQRVVRAEKNKAPFWVYNFFSSQIYFSSLHIAEWSYADYFKAMQSFQPRYLISYTSSIYELAKFFHNEQWSFTFKAIITNAEPLLDYQRKLLEKVFRCPVIETYGQAELVCFANTFPDGTMRESPDMGVTEIIKDNYDDEYGKLIATGFLNKAMPLIRYDTDDLISEKSIKSIFKKNNTGLPLFKKILGRSDDIITTSDGRKIVQIDGIFSNDIDIISGQIVQQTLTDFTIKVVPGNNWNDECRIQLKKNFLERINSVNVNIVECSKIQKTWAGKHRVIISELNQKV